MKDIFGATVGALCPVILGTRSVLNITTWIKGEVVWNIAANIIVNTFFTVIIVLLGVMCAECGSYLEKSIRKKYKQWRGLARSERV